MLYKLGLYNGLDKFGKPIFIDLDVSPLIQITIFISTIVITLLLIYTFKKLQSFVLLLAIQIVVFSQYIGALVGSLLGEATEHNGQEYIAPLNFSILIIITFWTTLTPFCLLLLKEKYFKNRIENFIKFIIALFMLLASLSVYHFFRY
ncbi:MAG: hypothetical protein AB7U85_09480 [Alphaproteobacteria bacterium]